MFVTKNIYNTVFESINDAAININDISAISVTYTPGLISCLLVGLNFAKGLSVGLNIPLIPINHLQGHLCSNLINNSSITFPYLCLLVSGGHTQIWEVNSGSDFNIISNTLDDAAGEAFDKGAKMLGLPYPGGPEIEKYAKNGDKNKYHFSIPNVKLNPLNFSFSGIKTSLYYKLKDINKIQLKNNLSNICSSYQEAILEILFNRLKMVLKIKPYKNISVVGGVACNKRFRDKSQKFEAKYNTEIHFPELEYCTDNGAMIAMAGYLKIKDDEHFSDIDIIPVPNIKI